MTTVPKFLLTLKVVNVPKEVYISKKISIGNSDLGDLQIPLFDKKAGL